MAKIKIGFYPYTYARVSAMKGSLIPRGEYAKLLKMGLNEITKYLEEKQYKKEIDEMATSYKGVELIEAALRKNLERTLNKLRRISNEGMKHLLDVYLRKWDVHNLKTIIRGIHSKIPKQETERLFVVAGAHNEEYYKKLLEKETVEDVIDILKDNELKKAYAESKIFGVENYLDSKYYEEVLDVASKLKNQGKEFAQFLKKEIDVLNIMTIIRMKKLGVKPAEIKKNLFTKNTTVKEEVLDKLLAKETPEEIIKTMIKSRILVKKLPEADYMTIELELRRRLYEEAMLLLHQHPLTVDVMLGYMFTKETEVRNLQILIKGKQLGLEEDLIQRGLVMGGTNA